ncbi:Poly [ADP-ribose] polymerase 2 [Hypsibius exemplaris]|uniref:Poly [ADP-ribose] polymerase n=1 Tax=Hypsibius exemplaris TaxID=2072580 RepID=A0A1W0WRV3_HYPEX|nr:Poly [ADP-ribose] polymerase 2 [Hypsibius exemplaris]
MDTKTRRKAAAANADSVTEEMAQTGAASTRDRGRPGKKRNCAADSIDIVAVNVKDDPDANAAEPKERKKGKAAQSKASTSGNSSGLASASAPVESGRPKRALKNVAPIKVESDEDEEDVQPPKKLRKLAKNADSDKPEEPKRKKAAAKKPKEESLVEEAPEPAALMTKKEIVMKGKVPVDELCPQADSFHVLCEGDVVWDVTLNQTAIDTNNNKFYIIQLLEHDERKAYSVYTRWGRVGALGQKNTEECGGSIETAKKQFQSKFKGKTNNDWNEREHFEKVPGKYDMVMRDFEATADDEPDAVAPRPSEPIKIPESKLSKPVQSLMSTIFNIRMMEQQVMEMNYDARKAPLGKLTTSQVKLGYATLKKIAALLEATPAISPGSREFTEASNEYYTRIPHSFGMRRPMIINTPGLLKRELELLETLGDIEVAMRVLNDKAVFDENPVDRHYNTLRMDIQPIEHTGERFKLIEQYLSMTHGPTHSEYTLELLDAFQLAKDADFKADIGNRMLLWHGSRLSNFVGILSQGLRIAPPEAPSTGYMFGKGIYFADVSTKSANYCFAQSSDSIGMMLLCEVALGQPNELFDANYDADKLPPGTYCTKGVGMYAPDISTHTTLEDGVKIPVGKCVNVSGKLARGATLQYNEYIVYNVNQVRLRYLVKVKFNYKRSSRY